MGKHKILIVEDEAIIALELESRLRTHGYQHVFTTGTGEHAINIARTKQPDVILMDIKLQGKINGIEAAEKIYKKHKIPIIYMTGNSHLISDIKLQKTHPVEILSKPASDWQIFSAIEKAVNRNE